MAKGNHNPVNAPGILKAMPPEIVTDIQTSIISVWDNPRPKDADELKDAIEKYFNFCLSNDLRCGIETFCTYIGIHRQTFWKWHNGHGCTPEMTNLIRRFKQVTLAVLEQFGTQGKLNPASHIFLLKCWGGYSEAAPFEMQHITAEDERKAIDDLSLTDLKSWQAQIEAKEKPIEPIEAVFRETTIE